MNREEIIKWLESLKAEIGKSEHRTLWHYAEAIDMAIEALQFAEHFDLLKEYQSLQEVVLCKDCRYYKKINPKAKSGMCYKDIVASAWNDDGFCSRGERKGGDDK